MDAMITMARIEQPEPIPMPAPDDDRLIAEFAGAIRNSGALWLTTKTEMIQALSTIRIELSRPNPSKARVGVALATIRRYVPAGLGEYLEQLETLVGPILGDEKNKDRIGG